MLTQTQKKMMDSLPHARKEVTLQAFTFQKQEKIYAIIKQIIRRKSMTAVVQVSEQYVQQFQELIESFPKQAVKLTMIKSDLNEEITKRIAEIKSGQITTKPLKESAQLRDRYVQH